ncbi:MAG: class I SAM-dependent methyltransferase [Rhodospirillaceae bacterium]|mgnify:CR=1 FL=1|nr:class I SAM-dependent methyltransferase [Rhodospirillaceae bacterium]
MQVIAKLVGIYIRYGYQPITGLSPKHTNNWMSDYTFLVKGTENCTPHLGITPHEIGFMECVLEAIEPKNILVIGNSFGWSTLALALSNPAARVVAMDCADEPFTLEWIDHTNAIAEKEGLSARAVKGRSPDDVDAVMDAEFDGKLDFVFFDGDHTKEAVINDFEAVHRHANPQCVYVFHDVLGFGLMEGVLRTMASSGLSGRVVYGSPSGMMIVYNKELEDRLALSFATYGATDLAMGMLNLMKQTETGRIIS